MKKYVFVLILVFILILSVFVISAKEKGLDKVEGKVFDLLNKNKAQDKTLKSEDKTRVIVKMKDNVDSKAMKRALNEFEKNNIKPTHVFSSVQGFSTEVSKTELEQLKNNPNVESVYLDKPVHAMLQDSVPLINATETWSLQSDGNNLTGAGQTVCIIDTGVDYTHPDLGGCNSTLVQTVLGDNVSSVYESSHNYSNDEFNITNITQLGFTNIAIHFVNISVENEYDYVVILDEDYSIVTWYTGFYEDVWSPSIPGDTIRILLLSDESITDYGYYADVVLNGTVDETHDKTCPDTGECTPSQTNLTGNVENLADDIESSHPYTDDYNNTWNITMPGFTNIAAHFVNISIESYWDYIYVSDGEGSVVAEYTGYYEDLWTPSVNGDTINITFVSDGSVTDYGFYINKVINGTADVTSS